jgi:hypothetical protein
MDEEVYPKRLISGSAPGMCQFFLNALKTNTSSHTVQMIPVERDIRVEVLDWGGTGRPLILIAGLAASHPGTS